MSQMYDASLERGNICFLVHVDLDVKLPLKGETRPCLMSSGSERGLEGRDAAGVSVSIAKDFSFFRTDIGTTLRIAGIHY